MIKKDTIINILDSEPKITGYELATKLGITQKYLQNRIFYFQIEREIKNMKPFIKPVVKKRRAA